MDLLQKLGLNAELQASDWGTLITRRASREPVDKGGWSLFFTWFVGSDMVSPAVNAPLRSAGEKSWFGWPTNPRIETMRNAWFEASDLDTQRKIARDIQEEAFSTVPYIPTGQFSQPTAYRNSLTGVIVAPVTFLWNVEKK
jgi:peptide/nickel transport system substrate-binding protein